MCVYIYMCVYVCVFVFFLLCGAVSCRVPRVVGWCVGWLGVVWCCRHVVVVVVLVLDPSCFVWWFYCNGQERRSMNSIRLICSRNVKKHLFTDEKHEADDDTLAPHPSSPPPCVHSTRLPCVRPTRPRVYIQHVPVNAGTTRTFWNLCARGAGTHEDVFEWIQGVFQRVTHHTALTTQDTRHNTTRQHNSSTTAQHTTTQHDHARPQRTQTQNNATPHPYTTHINPVPVQCILASQQFYNFCELFNFCSYRFQFCFTIICLFSNSFQKCFELFSFWSYSFFPELFLHEYSVER